MEFVSPSQGRMSFEEMFRQLVGYMKSEPDQHYHLIIGTDSLVYRKFRNRKIESLRQRILFETSLSLETAHLITTALARNGLSRLPVEIHLDVGQQGETRQIVREVVGMVSGSGYAAVIKPDAYGATKVADKHSK
jgi:predicted RNase H-related nuclease YkuK (DUF458 family)